MIKVFTDGSSRGNPGPGGYGIAISVDGLVKHVFRSAAAFTTNNEQELFAIEAAMDKLEELYPHQQAIIYTDSLYCYNIINNWMNNWANNGWTKKDGKPIKNLSVIQSIYNYCNKIPCYFQVDKVKGHDDLFGNELADILATGNKMKLKTFYIQNKEKFSLETTS